MLILWVMKLTKSNGLADIQGAEWCEDAKIDPATCIIYHAVTHDTPPSKITDLSRGRESGQRDGKVKELMKKSKLYNEISQ